MKRNTLFNILTVFTLMTGAALAGEIDVTADTNFVAKPKRKASAAVVKATEKASFKIPAPLVGPIPAPTQWVNTMEASMGPLSPRTTAALTLESGGQPLILWMGWAFAVIFGGVLLSQSLRTRRKYSNMLRAGERDTFYMPPNRRRF